MDLNYATLATSALGFTVALAWNDAALAVIRNLVPAPTEKAAVVSIAYAVIVTLAVILIVACINGARRATRRWVSGAGPHSAGSRGAGQCRSGLLRPGP